MDLPKSVRNIVEQVISSAKPRSIVLFGSRARGDHRTNSDFDIAVLGRSCSSPMWHKLISEISESNNSLYAIDLVEFESLPKGHQEKIQTEGKMLYESTP